MTESSRASKARRGAKILLAAVAAALLSTAPAAAQNDVLAALRDYSNRQAEWSERFDATLPEIRAVNSSQPTLSPEALGRMQFAIDRYRALGAAGGWPEVNSPKKAMELGTRDKNVVVLRERLKASGDLTQESGRPDVYDSYVAAAVRRFQLRHGLTSSGVLDAPTLIAMNVPVPVRLRQLEQNLARITETSATLKDRYVLVNIPAAEIEAVEFGRVRSRHTAVVGKTDRQSPLVNSKIYEINFNPYWTVPVSIVWKDLHPKMKDNPNYLSEQRIRIYKWGDDSVEYQYGEIDWSAPDANQYMFRQDPSELNSLGTMKINFHSPDEVYMHDTPQKTLFGEGARFHSSGCVRVQNVRELVTWLVAPNGWDRSQVDATVRSGQRLDVKLATQTQVLFAYVTAWVNADGVVHFRDDIYGRDGVEAVASGEGAFGFAGSSAVQ